LSELPASAHPKILALHTYWLKIAPGAGLLPGRQHMDPIDIPKLLANVWLLDVLKSPRRFRFRLIGTALAARGLQAKTGDFIEPLLAKTGLPDPLDDLNRAVSERQPVWFRGKARIPHERFIAELERVHLPMARDGAEVDMLLCLSVLYDSLGTEIGSGS
jgi:hypothetical protein